MFGRPSIDALSKALSSWGEKDGAIIVVSHDKAFCDTVGFTHVGTVENGTLTLEERGLMEKDWSKYDIRSDMDENTQDTTDDTTEKDEEEMRRKQKAAYNAPKRISKLEKMIEDCELRIARIEEEMIQVGNDVGKLVDLNDEKMKEEEMVSQMMDEWSDLEILLNEQS